MRVIGASELEALLPWAGLVRALERAFRSGCEAPARHVHALPGGATLLLMPAWGLDGLSGLKTVQVSPGNAALGLPAVQASYLLSDAATGAALALIDGGALTDRRTAAASALAARFLARPDSARHLVLGAGRVGRALAEGMGAVLPIQEVALWSRDPARAERSAHELRAAGHPARAVASPDPAGFDVVSAATLATAPLLRGDAVSPGTHVDLVGAFRPDMREADAALIARATVVADTRAGALREAGDLVQAAAEGLWRPELLHADLAELCRGERPGRRSAAEVTVFKSVGWAGEDLAAAAMAFRAA